MRWLQHLSLGDILGLIGIALSIVLAVIPAARKRIGQAWREAMIRAGRPERRYANWFIKTYGSYDSPYLPGSENLDLTRNFVSLYFEDPEVGSETRINATTAISESTVADEPRHNVLIEGDPGSGKSTLLKVHGLSLLRHSSRTGFARDRGQLEVPFLVSLRRLAAELDPFGSREDIFDYLVREILVREVGFDRSAAQEFLKHLLTGNRCLVLLDGLDEVTTERYDKLRSAILRFTTDRNPDQPTCRARVIVTCRKQNLIAIRDEWVGPVTALVYRIAPLRTSEIVTYLDQLRGRFRNRDGPEEFLAAVRASGTFDLHRTPLILAMSVGLFAKRVRYEIPHTVSALYTLMIAEMLDRHRFKGDVSANQFRMKDKYRALREFALFAAQHSIGFNDFGRKALVAFVQPLAIDLEAVSATMVEAFVDEIIHRSGLLTDVTDAGGYVFAHRSIQEHLVAEEIRLHGEAGIELLIDRVSDKEWRQVVLFYTSAAEQRIAGPFVRRLAHLDLCLAGHCLSAADVPDDVAEPIVRALAAQTKSDLAGDRAGLMQNVVALLAPTNSPRVRVQETAVNAALEVLAEAISQGRGIAGLSRDPGAATRLLSTIASSDAAEVAALAPQIAASVPDDPELVEPLWRCLATPRLATEPTRVIVSRLLHLAMDEECLNELQMQDPTTRPFIDAARRTAVYPFTKGQAHDSNLVTLLALADHYDARPARTNRFLRARDENPERFRSLERDRALTLQVTPFWPIRVATTTGILILLAAAIWALTSHGVAALAPFGWWSLLGPAIAVVASTILVNIQFGAASEDCAHPLEPVLDWLYAKESLLGIPYFLLLAVPGCLPFIALAPALADNLWAYLPLGTALAWLVHYLPLYEWTSSKRSWYVWRPNPYVDAYEDPLSRPWLTPPS